MSNWMRWVKGRQGTGYDKFLVILNPFIIPFDCYILRYPIGSHIPTHKDVVKNKKHYRLNLVLKKSKAGGEFICENCLFSTNRIHFFRSDVNLHSVTEVIGSPRYVLSIGWVI
jgi:Rps23 Pro-64 3,4-dihydroxylase Tpa1-like proline 4-hydroxylase